MHGYYIETSKAAKGEVPDEYVRRQTLKNAERYITPALKTFEEGALRSQGQSLQLERRLWRSAHRTGRGFKSAKEIRGGRGTMRCACLFGRALCPWDFMPLTLPNNVVSKSPRATPVVKSSSTDAFIANDLSLSPHQSMLIVTGPNMGGKSTYMRRWH